MFGKSVRPPTDLIVKFFEFGAAVKHPKVYHVFLSHFDTLGYQWNHDTCVAAMKLFFAVEDYRRFRNMWEYVVFLRFLPLHLLTPRPFSSGRFLFPLRSLPFPPPSSFCPSSPLPSLCIELGSRPPKECRSMMLEVLAKTGHPGDAQFFYETQIRNGAEVDRRFHELMMQNFIQRGYVPVFFSG
jgi:hypothetical protein